MKNNTIILFATIVGIILMAMAMIEFRMAAVRMTLPLLVVGFMLYLFYVFCNHLTKENKDE